MKYLIRFVKFIIETIELGFYYICLILSRGFFFYFYAIFAFFGKIFRFKFFNGIKKFFQKLQESSAFSLVFITLFIFSIFFYEYLYVNKDDVVYISDSVDGDVVSMVDNGQDNSQVVEEQGGSEDNTEYNLYRRYGAYNPNNIKFDELRQTNPDVVAWLTVDSTNINYPITQTNDNDYYLNHDIMGNGKISGWTFMDYRNSSSMSDQNTIFYGHNLFNKTAFGSISNMFTDNWFKNSNHIIVVRTDTGKYTYQVFSVYYIDPEVYYLQNNFYSNADYATFLNTLRDRSKYNFGVGLDVGDKIITLSTCTDDNSGRKVVHAKLMTQEIY